ncbi:MAG: SPW repeat protein [Bacteroidetes bacterium]|nr:SPW repeat protein [Bacteroidota bacterium]
MWAQLVNTALGLWLMVAPAVLSYNKIGADNCHITGPLVVSFAFVACWEATRSLRRVNFLAGLWLLAAPWVLGYNETLPIVNDMLVGALVFGFSFVEGKIEGSFGGGWKAIW